MRGHEGTFYLDLALMGLGGLMVITGDLVTGIIVAGAGVGLHYIGD